jgi:hypothetical protein
MRLLEQWGLLKLQSPFETFYDLEATDEDGQPVDFNAYRNKVRTTSDHVCCWRWVAQEGPPKGEPRQVTDWVSPRPSPRWCSSPTWRP